MQDLDFDYENLPLDRYDEAGKCPGRIHVVHKGDTLASLSERYHVSVSRIMFANPYVNIYRLMPGEELCIPTGEEKSEF
ncbi:MAG: LysM peptidoglycan-binding domain-containing protein [Lachnospiraceae bacterium]